MLRSLVADPTGHCIPFDEGKYTCIGRFHIENVKDLLTKVERDLYYIGASD